MASEFHIRNVFLADDDDDDQLIFIEALAAVAPDIKCETAFNGKEALEKLNELRVLPDLIFLDINMPLMDGFECLIRIKQQKDLFRIPVIIYSTAVADSSVITAQELAAHAYLTKPSEHKSLEEKLKKILSTDFSIPSPRIRIFSHHHFFVD